MKPTYQELLRENRRLRKENERLRRENQLLKEKMAALEKRIEELEGKDSDPPGFVKPNRKNKDQTKKPGRNKGHKGINRSVPSPDEVDEEKTLEPEECPCCGRSLSDCKPQEERERYVEDIKLPKRWVVKYTVKRYFCPDCKKLVEEKPKDVLPHHRLGIKAMSYILYLREKLRLPVNLIKERLEDIGFSLSEATIENITTEAAKKLEPTYQEYLEGLKEATSVNIDETGSRVSGNNYWLWTITKPGTTIFHHDKRRSHQVVEELLGKKYEGVICSDFYSAYNPLKAIKQKGWAHLLRDSRELSGEEGEKLHKALKELWKRATEWVTKYQDRAPPVLREWLADRLEREVRILTRRDWSKPEVGRIVKRLKKHLKELFTFVRIPEVEGTNNRAERALRPYVVKRKISGGHRSWAGARKHAVLMSVLATCNQRGEDFRQIVESALLKQATSEN
jgi:transposase-like protein